MKEKTLKEGEKAVVIAINGNQELQNYFLVNGIAIGTELTKNYSPRFSGLINISFAGKMLSLRVADFNNIEFEKI